MTASYNLELLYLHLQPNYNQFNYSTMAKITKEAALLYHSQGKPGKIEVVPTKPYSTQTDLSLAYSPGVAEPCLEIEKNPQDAYKYTAKGNLVAVISNGTAVLGLGDIGALSGKPVMEGKGLLFKIYAGIDVFDIEVNEKDPDKFIEAVKAIAPTFGGINLEDIKAPECFEIERRLKEELDIPVMHDDQHGTAIISSAGLLNALEVAGKKIEEVKIVVNGAGASATSCTKLYEALGARRENILMLDSKGVITSDRENLTEQKRYFATDRRDVHTLAEAIKGADVFLGLSKGNVLTQDMVRSMADHPIVFALANPTPERFEVTQGEVEFNGKNLLEMPAEDRAREGIFLSFQYPVEIPGVSTVNFLKTAVNEIRKYHGQPPYPAGDFLKMIRQKMELVGIDNKLLNRSLNEGFSGGEKKKNEIFQMAVLEPKLAILDETDSGLDIDALRTVANGVNKLKKPENATIVITHYQRLLDYIVPDVVHVLYDGRIVKTAGKELVAELEEKGYDWIKEEVKGK